MKSTYYTYRHPIVYQEIMDKYIQRSSRHYKSVWGGGGGQTPRKLRAPVFLVLRISIIKHTSVTQHQHSFSVIFEPLCDDGACAWTAYRFTLLDNRYMHITAKTWGGYAPLLKEWGRRPLPLPLPFPTSLKYILLPCILTTSLHAKVTRFIIF